MADILLIDPPFPERPWDINWLTLFPPKGLMYIAAYLIDNEGFDVEIMDTKQMQYEYPSLLRRSIEEIQRVVSMRVSRMQPRIIGLTSTTISYLSALKIAQAAKEAASEATVVMGGVHVTHTANDTLREPYIDVVVRGEGERQMLDIANKVPYGHIRGISYKNCYGGIVHNPPQVPLEADKIPVPAYEILDMSKYAYFVLMCTRGCPHNCSFCEIPDTHCRNVRFRDIVSLTDEIELALSLNHRLELRLEDEFLGFRKLQTENFLDWLKIKDFSQFRATTRPDAINDGILRMLKSAGCTNLYIGLESGSDNVLKFNGRGIKVSQILEIAKKFEKNEMLFHGSFILGLPGERVETLEMTLRVAKKCCDSTFSVVKKNFEGLLNIMPFRLIVENSRAEFNLLSPNPGTPIFKNPEKFRYRIFHTNWELYDCNTSVGEPYDVSAKDIEEFKSHAFKEIQKQMDDYGLPVDWWDVGYKG